MNIFKRHYKLLLTFMALSLLVLGAAFVTFPEKDTMPQVAKENTQPGTTTWKSKELEEDKEKRYLYDEEAYETVVEKGEGAAAAAEDPYWHNTAIISGYADKTSINKGSSITFFVSTTKSRYDIQIYRMGYYSGTGGRLIKSVTGRTGKVQLVSKPNSTTGLVDLNWTASYTLDTTSTWTSGIYLAKLIASDGSVSYIPFIVRDDAASSDITYVVAVSTWQAYNNWGGKSLYDYNSTGARSVKVSYNRPYAQWSGAGGFFDGDYNMLQFLESKGFNITYATSLDVQTNSNLLNNSKVYLSNYHDEYWSSQMRANLLSYRDSGKDLAFFDANNIYWQIRFEADTRGNANRIQVCYKDAGADPITNRALTTVQWRSDPVNKPENEVLGVMYESDFAWGSAYPWVVKNANHWMYSGTGLKDGDKIDGLVGYEYDKVYNNGKSPLGQVILSESPVVDGHGISSVANSSMYTAASGARVFNAGTIYWAWKLADTDYISMGPDSRVQKITTNILTAMITNAQVTPMPSTSPSPTLTTTPTVTPTASPTITVVPTATPSPVAGVIYDEKLATGWVDWSWSSQNTLQDITRPYKGTKNILWKPLSGWAGLYLHSDIGMNTTGFTAISFAVQASGSAQKVGFQLYDESNKALGPRKDISLYGGDPDQKGYKVYVVPLTDLNATNVRINGFDFQALSDNPVASLYVDEISFLTAIPSPTVSPTQQPLVTPTSVVTPTPTSGPTATPVPTGVPTAVTPTATPAFVIYNDMLASGWQNWSWDAAINFANTTPVAQGSASIAYTSTAAWSGLDIHNPTGINTAPYTKLHFTLQASSANQSYAVFMTDSAGKQLKYPIGLSQFGGDPVQGAWKVYDIPLADLNANGKVVTGITIHEWTGAAQPALYIDDIKLQ